MTEEEMRIWASPLTTVSDSEFPSDSQQVETLSAQASAQTSATSSSKRSRDSSMDSDSAEASKVSKVGKSQEPEESERPKSTVKSAYKRANLTIESIPATDSRYLHPGTQLSSREPSTSRHTSSHGGSRQR
jgi:hypothetical protein